MRKATLSLGVIDGGGRRLPLTLHRPAGDALCAPLLPLLEQAGAVFGTEEGPFGVPFMRLATPEGAGAAKGEPLRVVHARALPGVVKGKAPNLDMKVLALPADGTFPAALLARVIAGAPEGRERLSVDGIAQAGGLVPLTAPGAAARLATGGETIGLLLAAPDMAEVFSAMAVALAGGAVTAYEAMHAPQGASFAPRLPEKGAPGVMGLILAACAALGEAGQGTAAERLHNGFACALEDGLHTEETALARPYAQVLDRADFCAEVQNRLGLEPRVLTPMRYAEEERRRPSLTVLG